MEVKPYTKELRAKAEREEGRSIYQFSENKTVCILPSLKYYETPEMKQRLSKTRV